MTVNCLCCLFSICSIHMFYSLRKPFGKDVRIPSKDGKATFRQEDQKRLPKPETPLMKKEDARVKPVEEDKQLTEEEKVLLEENKKREEAEEKLRKEEEDKVLTC